MLCTNPKAIPTFTVDINRFTRCYFSAGLTVALPVARIYFRRIKTWLSITFIYSHPATRWMSCQTTHVFHPWLADKFSNIYLYTINIFLNLFLHLTLIIFLSFFHRWIKWTPDRWIWKFHWTRTSKICIIRELDCGRHHTQTELSWHLCWIRGPIASRGSC